MKVLVFGSSGLVGSSLVRNLENSQQKFETIASTRNEVDLFSFEKTQKYINDLSPDIIINAAAKVGGILANNSFRTDFILENLKININILESIRNLPSINLINLGSSCIYPLGATMPIAEESLMTGKLEPTNSPYAMAKLTAIEMGDALSKEYGHKILNLMPTNLYGPNDNFSENESHVIPGLVSKLHKAKIENLDSFDVWGTGKPLREFLYVDDLSKAIIHLINSNFKEGILNVGSGEEVSISNLVTLIKKVVGFKGKINFDTNYPDGNPRKLLDSKKIRELGWKPTVTLEEGLQKTYAWYVENN